jgi:predicted DNA-binding protein (MmcQ/YjbR family)
MEDPRLQHITEISLGFPDAVLQYKGPHASYLVRNKVFAYYLSNHHDDGIVGLNCKVLPGDNSALIRTDPVRFYMPPYVGPRGWVGLRLDVGEIDWNEVAELIQGSYQLTAPRRLAALVSRI